MKLTDKQIEIIKRDYLVCALWASNNDEGDPLDDNFDLNDIDVDSNIIVRNIVLEFISFVPDQDLEMYLQDHNFEQLGHDLFLTQNGHGAGFWDRQYPSSEKELGDRLTKLCKLIGEVHIFDSDGKIYIERSGR